MSAITVKPSKYIQLAGRLRESITTGVYPVGQRLPPFTALQQEFGITQKTLEQALGLLEKDGLIERRWRSGVYVSSPNARPRLGMIGMLSFGMASDAADPYWSALLGSIRNAIGELGLQTLLIDRPEHFKHWEKLDGLLMADPPHAVLGQAIPENLPRVSMLHDFPGVSSVVLDDYQGTRLAVRHLLDLGHRRIAFLGICEDDIAENRLRGYRDELTAAGVGVLGELVSLVRINEEDPGKAFIHTGQTAIGNWNHTGYSLWQGFRPTGLLVQSDSMTVGALRGFVAEGVRVPQDISIIASDGTDTCLYTSPQLTSLTLPLGDVGATSVRLLLSQIAAGDKSAVHREILPAALQVRESTGPAPY